MIPLTKTLDPDDYKALAHYVQDLNALKSTAGQHEHRAWEYSMALDAFTRWWSSPLADYALIDQSTRWLDVGAAGSLFPAAIRQLTSMEDVHCVDPNINTTIEDYHGESAAVITAISVLEHVDSVPAFLRACMRNLRPGGLLFLTMDLWNCEGPDQAHFHWMRKRIFNQGSWKRLLKQLQGMGAQKFGEADWAYHGDQLFGSYSFASLCVVKKVEG